MGICGALAGASEVNHNIWTADLAAAMFAVIGIMAALRVSEKGGHGQYVEVPMADATLAWMVMPLGIYFATGQPPPVQPGIDTYETADGARITLNVGPVDKFWQNLCSVTGQEQLSGLAREEREKRSEELNALLRGIIRQKTREEWVKALGEAGVPSGPVRALDEVAGDPYVRDQQLVKEVEGPGGRKIKQIAHPVRFSETLVEIRKVAPGTGEDTKQILLDLGFTSGEIEALKKEKVV
jgi:formyl-CoA transferase